MPFAISSSPAAPAAQTRAPAAKLAKAAPNAESAETASQLAAAKKMAKDFRAARQDARSIAKAQAKEKAARLREELRLLTRLLAGNPKELARQVARIAKELRGVLKDFSAAHKGDVADAAPPSDGEDANDATPQSETPIETRRREAGIEDTPEAREMKDFIGEIRGFLKKLRDLLQEAKIKAGPAAKDATEKRSPFDVAEGELDTLEDDLNKAFQDVSAEAKQPAGERGGLVSIQA